MQKDKWKKGRSEGGSKERGGGERREGMEGGSSEATQILFFMKPTALYVQGSSYDIVILTHKQQAWVSQRDIRFVISDTFLTPIYSLVALRKTEQQCPSSVASLMPMRAHECVCGLYLFSPESTEQHYLFFTI